MELALYHFKYGYYASSGSDQIGREGDFYTSVSVGETFGMLLSFAIEKKWTEICPNQDLPLVLVEQGAHDGQLARDILDGFRERNSPLLNRISYRIIDPHGTVILPEDSEGDYDQIKRFAGFEEAKAQRGIFLCNELLDAFPVRRFVWLDGIWQEWYVRADPGENQLSLVPRSVDSESNDEDFDRFQRLVAPFQADFEEGYSTEYCPSTWKWIKECSGVFEESGCWWMIDYGHEAADYFDRSRSTGTLRCFYQHRAHEDPLWRPGQTDLTAHLNFTDLKNAGNAAGLQFAALVDQSVFLTKAATEWLIAIDGKLPDSKTARRLRQFQTLTHPSMMGRCFRVAELNKPTP